MTLTTFALISAIVSAIALVITWLWSHYYLDANGLRLEAALVCTTVMATAAFQFSQNREPHFFLWMMVISPAVLMVISIVRHLKKIKKNAL